MLMFSYFRDVLFSLPLFRIEAPKAFTQRLSQRTSALEDEYDVILKGGSHTQWYTELYRFRNEILGSEGLVLPETVEKRIRESTHTFANPAAVRACLAQCAPHAVARVALCVGRGAGGAAPERLQPNRAVKSPAEAAL